MIELRYKLINDSFEYDLLNIWSDEDVIKYTNIKTPCTLEEVKDRIKILKKFDVFIVMDEDNVIGIIGCPCIDKEKLKFGIFYHFCKLNWGKGYATNATKWLLDFMRKKYGEVTIVADVVENNIASEKILKYFGFSLVSDEDYFERNGIKMKIHSYKL